MFLRAGIPLVTPTLAATQTFGPLSDQAELLERLERTRSPDAKLTELRDSIERDIYPSARTELLDYTASAKMKLRMAIDQVPMAVGIGIPGYERDVTFSVWARPLSAIGGICLAGLSLSAVLVTDFGMSEKTAGGLAVGGLLLLSRSVMLGGRQGIRRKLNTHFSDLHLMRAASSLAVYQGDRIAENHFNALIAHEEYIAGINGNAKDTEYAQWKLMELAQERGSIHALYYARLLYEQGHSPKPPSALRFSVELVEQEMRGNETARDINLMGLVTSIKFRKAYFDYLEARSYPQTEVLEVASDIVARQSVSKIPAPDAPHFRIATIKAEHAFDEEAALLDIADGQQKSTRIV